MGRVYDIEPDVSLGELPAKGIGRVEYFIGDTDEGEAWHQMPFVTRVEFDDDADEGESTVTFWRSVDGRITQNPVTRQPMKGTCRARVRLVRTTPMKVSVR